MTQPRFRGIFPVVPTTFTETGALDLDSQKRAVDFMIDAGSDGPRHSRQLLRAIFAGRRRTRSPHAHDPRTRERPRAGHRHDESLRQAVCAARSRRAQDMGAAMVMVMLPYHGATFRVPEAQIYDFYARVSDAVDVPIMIQDAPASGTMLSAAFLARIAREIEQVGYFKIETPGAANKLREIIRLGGEAIEGPLDGEEAITLLADLEAGVTGSMTGGGFPDGIRPIIEAHAQGNGDLAFELYQRWLPLINHENRQAGLLAAKALMKRRAA